MTTSSANRIIVFAPNWLGDAVMAVPCVGGLRRHFPGAKLAVAARAGLSKLFEMVPGVDETLALEPPGRFGGWRSAARDARRVRASRFDVAILLPNSFRSAWIAARAGVSERWGYATDGRGPLLTRSVPMVPGGHQAEYYVRLLRGLGIDMGRWEDAIPPPRLEVSIAARERAAALLAADGWKQGDTLVGIAPGAAYGNAKQWGAERFGAVARKLADAGVRTVVVGSQGDAAACAEVASAAGGRATRKPAINLAGRTDLVDLAAIIAACSSFLSNDSGAMHLASAVGVPVTAIFGSTREWETRPLAEAVSILTAEAWCRPCMLRDCPIEAHPCMTGVSVERVETEVMKQIGAR